MAEIADDKLAAKACFDKAGLDPELYRLGNTKVPLDDTLIFLVLYRVS